MISLTTQPLKLHIVTCLVDTGFGLVIGFFGLLQTVTTSNYNRFTDSRRKHFIFSVCCVFISRSLLTASNDVDSSASVFTSLHLAAVSRRDPTCSQPLAIVCLLVVFVHHWLVLTVCRLTIPTADHCFQLRFGSRYIASRRTA
jgi:hypothetical protein